MAGVNPEKYLGVRRMGERVEVISPSFRAAHALNLILYTLLILTGLILLWIEAFAWLAYLIGITFTPLIPGADAVTIGVEIARSFHRFLGFIWGVLIIIYSLYLLLFRRLTVFTPLKKSIRQQFREAKALMNTYLLGKPLPKDIAENIDRHNVLVSYTVIILIISSILIGISGFFMAFRDAFAITLDQYRLFLLLHDIGFGLGILYTLLHLFAVFSPLNRPILIAMFRDGFVAFEWAKKHMPLYVERVKQ